METRLQCCFEKIIIEFSVSCTEAKRKLEITFLGFHVIFFSLQVQLGVTQQEGSICFPG